MAASALRIRVMRTRALRESSLGLRGAIRSASSDAAMINACTLSVIAVFYSEKWGT